MTSARDDRHGPDEGPGGRLRREREERGLSSQQVAEQLKLDVAVIEALEDNDFPALGAPVFARGHLRRYAALLGIPEGALLAAYDEARQPEAPTLVPRAHFERLPERHVPRWPWALGGLGALLAAGTLAVIGGRAIKWPWQDSGPAEGQIGGSSQADGGLPSRTTVTPPSAVEGPAVAPGNDRGAAAPAASDAASTGESARTSSTDVTAAAGMLKLDFRFAQDSWIEIFDGTGKAVLYDLGAAGSTRSISAVAPLSVTVGNAPAVALSVNGRPVALPRPEPGQTVVRVTVERSGAVR
jgi:cytoskeleton protein RodZ